MSTERSRNAEICESIAFISASLVASAIENRCFLSVTPAIVRTSSSVTASPNAAHVSSRDNASRIEPSPKTAIREAACSLRSMASFEAMCKRRF